jgi:tRNA dimethylallyltransferase
VYKGLDIGTGKITKKEMRSVPHYGLDIISPKKQFSVSEYKIFGEKAIEKIIKKRKVPIVCGGTGFYIEALIDGVILPEVPPNLTLRKKLEKKPASELFLILKKLDPQRVKKIDRQNSRRLIRAIEIAKALGKVPKRKIEQKYNTLIIGTTLPDKLLKEKINKRLKKRIKIGMIEEARKLHKKGLSWKKMRSLGLEYKFLADLLEQKISKKEFTTLLETAIWQYSRRQITWFKKNKKIKWFDISKIQEKKEMEKKVGKFLNS